MDNNSWVNDLSPTPTTAPVPHSATAGGKRGRPALTLPSAVLESAEKLDEWHEVAAPNGKAANSLIYALRQYAKDRSLGLKAQITSPPNVVLVRPVEGSSNIPLGSVDEPVTVKFSVRSDKRTSTK